MYGIGNICTFAIVAFGLVGLVNGFASVPLNH